MLFNGEKDTFASIRRGESFFWLSFLAVYRTWSGGLNRCSYATTRPLAVSMATHAVPFILGVRTHSLLLYSGFVALARPNAGHVNIYALLLFPFAEGRTKSFWRVEWWTHWKVFAGWTFKQAARTKNEGPIESCLPGASSGYRQPYVFVRHKNTEGRRLRSTDPTATQE